MDWFLELFFFIKNYFLVPLLCVYITITPFEKLGELFAEDPSKLKNKNVKWWLFCIYISLSILINSSR